MSMSEKWTALSQKPPVRTLLVAIGFALIALTPVVGPIPGPGGIIVFGAGLTLVLKYSGWAKRLYVRLKRKHPKKGAWADWSLRRRSAMRRHALMKEREMAEQATAVPTARKPDAAPESLQHERMHELDAPPRPPRETEAEASAERAGELASRAAPPRND
jgi:hypothetical protein